MLRSSAVSSASTRKTYRIQPVPVMEISHKEIINVHTLSLKVSLMLAKIMKFHKNLSGWSRFHPCGQTGRSLKSLLAIVLRKRLRKSVQIFASSTLLRWSYHLVHWGHTVCCCSQLCKYYKKLFLLLGSSVLFLCKIWHVDVDFVCVEFIGRT